MVRHVGIEEHVEDGPAEALDGAVVVEVAAKAIVARSSNHLEGAAGENGGPSRTTHLRLVPEREAAQLKVAGAVQRAPCEDATAVELAGLVERQRAGLDLH